MVNVAVLIDADNVSPNWVEAVLDEAGTLGTLALKRVYGDFSKHDKAWRELCARFAIHPIQQFPNTKGKNASDITLVIDAMDMLHSGRYQSFCLVSSDSDFSRLATRLREDGLDVWGFGEQKTPTAFVNACTKFVYVEILHAAQEEDSRPVYASPLVETLGAAASDLATDQPTTAKSADHRALRPLDKALRKHFIKAIESSDDEDGWAHLGGVGGLLGTWMPDFDPRNYGYKKLSDLVRKCGWFEVKQLANGKGGLLIRTKLAAPASKKAK